MRIDQLTFTRFIAASLIVVYHFGDNVLPFKNELVSFAIQQGNIGVSYFFVLSGFVMIAAYWDKDELKPKIYYINRFARLFPLYLFSLFLTLTVFLFKVEKASDYFIGVLLLQSWFPEKAMLFNQPAWSLSVEVFFYALFPVLLNKVYLRNSKFRIAFFILSFWLISQVIFHGFVFDFIRIKNISSEYWLYHPPFHLNSFLVGNLFGIIYLEHSKKTYKNLFPFIILIFGIILYLLKEISILNYHNGMMAVLFGILIVLIALSEDVITKFFKHRFLVFLGEISFGIYILQFPVWFFLTDYRLRKYFHFTFESSPEMKFYFRFLFLLMLSIVCYFTIERPIRKLIKDRLISKAVAID